MRDNDLRRPCVRSSDPTPSPTLSGALELLQPLLQLQGETYFAEAGCPHLKGVTRLLRPAALLLALARGDVRASQVGLVAVDRQEFAASGELLGGFRERLLLDEEKATDTMSHPGGREPRQSFGRPDSLDELVVTAEAARARS
jgi:hypothetical protein